MAGDSFTEKTQDVAVLTRSDTVMGIPMPYFVFVLSIGIPTSTMVSVFLGIPVTVLALVALYQLHQLDPQGVEVWVDRVRGMMSVWRAGRRTRRAIKFL
jgi:type IV secretory pathway VirB3-like protein